MKAIMISIQPQWVEKILNKEKTIEIRKTMPNCELPCKVYIYCTKPKNVKENIWKVIDPLNQFKPFYSFDKFGSHKDIALNGKVVAEFILDKVDKIEICDPDIMVNGEIVDIMGYKSDTCLTLDEFMYYIGYGNDHDGWGSRDWDKGYGWHIDNLKIYDKSKELSEFRKELDCDDYPCNKNCDCKYNYYDYSEGCWACGIDFDGSNCIYKQIKRPPQSWCYVEEVKSE